MLANRDVQSPGKSEMIARSKGIGQSPVASVPGPKTKRHKPHDHIAEPSHRALESEDHRAYPSCYRTQGGGTLAVEEADGQSQHPVPSGTL